MLAEKGCDASNIHDEEPSTQDAKEMYYSDDEKEREAKNKPKKGARAPEERYSNNKQHPKRRWFDNMPMNKN